jgi:hypothetical protein
MCVCVSVRVCVRAAHLTYIPNASITRALLPVGLLFTPPVYMCVCVCVYVHEYVNKRKHIQSAHIYMYRDTQRHTHRERETPTLT